MLTDYVHPRFYLYDVPFEKLSGMILHQSQQQEEKVTDYTNVLLRASKMKKKNVDTMSSRSFHCPNAIQTDKK